ncbi:hypothetical protein F5Y03DRAFT_376834 [Xylaria venustula]|nr:hypothetical protein F5Y03DRAFT_376834 [Xylaria venustula]
MCIDPMSLVLFGKHAVPRVIRLTTLLWFLFLTTLGILKYQLYLTERRTRTRKREMDGSDDSKETLRQIVARYRQPIFSLLLNLQRYQTLQKKQLDIEHFLSNLECFYTTASDRTVWRQQQINAFEEENYVALSYTWNPSKHEDESSEGCFIETSNGGRSDASPVRNCVFERIAKYMLVERVKLLWIDRHSIPQEISDPAARRIKEAGIQCMDGVYELSKHPVALLGRPLASSRELTLLRKVMLGRIQFSRGDNHQDATDALQLLFEITSDLWWQRAWTFQENYKGGKKMTLLIQHPECCDKLKEECGIFGEVPGELCVLAFRWGKAHLCAYKINCK